MRYSNTYSYKRVFCIGTAIKVNKSLLCNWPCRKTNSMHAILRKQALSLFDYADKNCIHHDDKTVLLRLYRNFLLISL